jgi:hypothetical protein
MLFSTAIPRVSGLSGVVAALQLLRSRVFILRDKHLPICPQCQSSESKMSGPGMTEALCEHNAQHEYHKLFPKSFTLQINEPNYTDYTWSPLLSKKERYLVGVGVVKGTIIINGLWLCHAFLIEISPRNVRFIPPKCLILSTQMIEWCKWALTLPVPGLFRPSSTTVS